jgi:conjugative relaxase-like TrwC/TraI family protein
MLTIRAMSGGAGYAQRHLEHSDYYDEHRRVQGEWHGRGAELLGLRGEVTQKQFEAVREGLHPETGEFLRPRHSADRISPDGSEQSKGRSLYDLTFSAPKSVSIQALVGGDECLVAAHDKAVREAIAEAESHAATRIRLNGANEDRMTANWIVATYRHDTSRELDPQLYTHAVAANLTYDGVEGRWKALQASGLYERRAYLTEVYRNALAREVRGLGYEIEPRRDSKGKDHGFEIRGVSNELLEKYSVRSAQRDAAIERFTVEHGRKPTDNEVAVLVRESRADKLAEIATDKVREQQQARLAPEEKHTHEEIGRITHAIRDDMKQRGELERGIVFERHIPLQWTEAQKKDLSNYQEGQVLLFHRSSHGIGRHESLTVERADTSHIVARDQHGVERTVSPTQARSFSVHERQQIDVAPGDRLLLTGNRREADFRATNGELTKVRGVDGGRIQLEDGRTLPANYREFDHGYAITAHRSQGKTVDAVVLSGDTMKQEQFYVAASRGRDGITIITSDVDRLRESLGISTARPSATELAREQAQTHRALEHGLAHQPVQNIEPPAPQHEISHGHDLGMSL